MTPKILLASGFVLLLILIGGVVYILIPRAGTDTPGIGSGSIFDPKIIVPLNPGSTEGPGGGVVVGGSTETIELPVFEGMLTVRDFTRSPRATTSSDGSYVALTPPGDDSFEVIYIKSDNSFVVSLFAEPLGEVRKRATEFIMSEFGINESDVCTLIAEVTLPRGVSSFYDGKSLGFPGCPGATALPGD